MGMDIYPRHIACVEPVGVHHIHVEYTGGNRRTRYPLPIIFELRYPVVTTYRVANRTAVNVIRDES